jgi:uncharacterized protein (TIGR02001 family)
MLKSVRSLMAATVLTSAGLFATPALANAGDAGIELSGNSAIVSEYRFRGVDLSGGDIAVQGGVDLSHSSGFYLGTWGSSLEEDLGYGHTELDVYGGWGGDLGGVSVDVGAIYYLYPNADNGVTGPTDYYEFYGSVGKTVGPVDLTFGVAYAPDQGSLGSTDNLYLYGDMGFGIPDTPLSFSGHLGYTDGFLTFTPNSKAWDYSVGADLALGEVVSVGVAYVDAEGVSDGVVLTLGASF